MTRARLPLIVGFGCLDLGVLAYRVFVPEGSVRPLTIPIALGALVLLVVTVHWLRQVPGNTGERVAWRGMLRAVAAMAVGSALSETLMAVVGPEREVAYLGVLIFGIGNLVGAHFMYQALIAWGRSNTMGVLLGDFVNGICAVLVLMAIGTWLRPSPAGASTIDVLERQAAMGAFGVAIVLLGSTLVIARMAGLFGDRRLWLVVAVNLIMFGPITACLVDPLGAGAASEATALSAMTLLVLAAGMPTRRRKVIAHDQDPTAAGSLAIASLAVTMLVLVGFRADPEPLITSYCAAAVLGVSSWLFRAVRGLELLQATRKLALTDDLTGIANRRAIQADLEQKLGEGVPTTLIIVDLDDFKLVNDRYGHVVGDQLLRQVARIFAEQLPRDAKLARLGGDEFAVLMNGLVDDDAVAVARRLIEASAPHLDIEGRPLRVRASVGVATSPAHGGAVIDATELMRRADTAMYRAKTSRTGAALYDRTLDALAQEELDLLEDLREELDEAGEGAQIVVHYQPQLRAADDVVVGAEALVRWEHPELGLLSPVRFVELAERNGLMGALTTKVMLQAADQWLRWRDAGAPLRISVNLSAGCLAQPGLLALLDEVVDRGVDPAEFVLEITETSVMADPELAIATMTAMAARGFEISIDDYGTGYSSLSYLNTLPASELKIDKSFVDRLLSDDRTEAIVAGTIELAHRLGMRLVAEGVEDEATQAVLRGLGCDEAQGYLHARPMPAGELAGWMMSRRPAATVA